MTGASIDMVWLSWVSFGAASVESGVWRVPWSIGIARAV